MRNLWVFMAALMCQLCLAQPPVHPTTRDHQDIIRLVNHERVKHHLKPLVEDKRLSVAAQCQAKWMIKVNKMDHLQGAEPERGRSFEEFKTNWGNSDWHAINRMVRAGYMTFDNIYKPVVANGQAAATAVEDIHDLIGENVAYGSKATPMDRFSPKRIVQGWMDSPGHRKAILNPRFKEIGVGYAVTPGVGSRNDQAAAWCTVFSTPELREK
jgi:uncharacterized protein YkwD